MADQKTSFELSWLREQFSTVGKNHRLINVQPESKDFRYELIEVEIGKNRFLLFHNTEPNLPTGLVVGVSKVNGKKIDRLLEEQGQDTILTNTPQ